MIYIAVCEDEAPQADYLKALLDRWQELSGSRALVDVFCSAEQFLFEADGHYVVLKTADGENMWRWKENFSEAAAELLEKDFFLLRRGLCVNISRITRIGRTECELENGELLPVGKGKYQALNEAFIAYYKGRAE